jgi:hypothetical protein
MEVQVELKTGSVDRGNALEVERASSAFRRRERAQDESAAQFRADAVWRLIDETLDVKVVFGRAPWTSSVTCAWKISPRSRAVGETTT